METSFSRKRLVVDLLRRGVSPAYAWRVAGELANHAEDLEQSGSGTRAGLGDVELLAAEIVEQYRKRTFAGRHPVLSFAVAPFPLIIVAIVGFWHVGALFIYAGMQVTNYAALVALLVHSLSMFVPAMMVTWLLCRLARGAGLNWRRAALACLPIFAVAFLFNSSLKLDEMDPQAHGVLMFGLNLPLSHFFGRKPSWAFPMVWTPLGRVALPLCVVLWMFVRERALVQETLSQNEENLDGDTDFDPRLQNAQQAA